MQIGSEGLCKNCGRIYVVRFAGQTCFCSPSCCDEFHYGKPKRKGVPNHNGRHVYANTGGASSSYDINAHFSLESLDVEARERLARALYDFSIDDKFGSVSPDLILYRRGFPHWVVEESVNAAW